MKKRPLILLAVLAAAVWAFNAFGAVTLTNDTVDRAGFVVNAYSADFSGCETIKAAVTGKSIYIERIYINAHDAETITFGAGETGGAVTATVLGPISAPADDVVSIVFTRPIKVTAATALTLDASSNGDVLVIVQGYIK